MGALAMDPGLAVVERLCSAMNEHDLDALVDVFDADVVSETPAHPQRTFHGSDQVRRNWEQIFGGVPDLQAELLGAVVQGDTVWAEWDWHGTRRDGTDHRMRGVTILRLKASRVVSVHFYMEPVEEAGVGPDDAVRRIVAGVQATGAIGTTGSTEMAVSR